MLHGGAKTSELFCPPQQRRRVYANLVCPGRGASLGAELPAVTLRGSAFSRQIPLLCRAHAVRYAHVIVLEKPCQVFDLARRQPDALTCSAARGALHLVRRDRGAALDALLGRMKRRLSGLDGSAAELAGKRDVLDATGQRREAFVIVCGLAQKKVVGGRHWFVRLWKRHSAHKYSLCPLVVDTASVPSGTSSPAR